MPKVMLAQLPLSGLFALTKPSGLTLMSVINDIMQLVGNSHLFVEADKLEKCSKGKIPTRGKCTQEIVKIGQGGTLDPLFDGVLVIGIGKGTKRLNEFLDCVKNVEVSPRYQEYCTTALLGCETDTYDSKGSRVCIVPWRHVTRFSALKMEGRLLYDYAWKGIALPWPIKKRKVTIHSLEILKGKEVTMIFVGQKRNSLLMKKGNGKGLRRSRRNPMN
ncbi:pseudouridine synthase [Suillus ampliporus]|nr:pseudouridine synthase [Suillus ampliporus]